tara:strand:+ start:214 stop:495 length:282 start_codon:yes stop_codon:yes gene_type:complete
MTKKLETKKQLWEVPFTRLPEVLTIEDIAEFLRIDSLDVEKLIVNNELTPLPLIGKIRVFKGFLLSYMTQQNPTDMGLASRSQDEDNNNGNYL